MLDDADHTSEPL